MQSLFIDARRRMLLRLKIVRGSLRNRRGKVAGREIVVRPRQFTIGTAPDCDLRCPSLVISRHHCMIQRDADRIVVRDRGSRLGTFVNGARIDQSACLFHGDRLRVGRLEFEVILSGRAAASPVRRPAKSPSPMDKSGRETVHQATDTVVDLVARIAAAARRAVAPRSPAAMPESRESGSLPRS
jgi:pSer/pThr/pTyr-binding forkhead associated (FHA) protein